MRLTDWLGTEYGVGDTIIYPVMSGRTVSMQQAIVLDIWVAYYCHEDWKWKRLNEGDPIPTKEEFEWDRSGDQPVRASTGRKPVRTEIRVKLQPEGKSSRGYSTRTDEIAHWVDPEGNDIEWNAMRDRILQDHDYDMNDWDRPWNERKRPDAFDYSIRREAITPKPVTLKNHENITVVGVTK